LEPLPEPAADVDVAYVPELRIVATTAGERLASEIAPKDALERRSEHDVAGIPTTRVAVIDREEAIDHIGRVHAPKMAVSKLGDVAIETTGALDTGFENRGLCVPPMAGEFAHRRANAIVKIESITRSSHAEQPEQLGVRQRLYRGHLELHERRLRRIEVERYNATWRAKQEV
jgi:hypothetical protein